MPTWGYNDHQLYNTHIPYRGLVPAIMVAEFLPDFRILVVNRLGVPYVELDAATLHTVRWELNGIGSCTFENPIEDPKVKTYPRLLEDEIQIRLDTDLVWQGVPWRETADDYRVSFECQGLLSYFTKRFITYTSLEYTSLEQFSIAWNLMSHAQTGTNMDLNIEPSDYSPSGKIRSRRYDRSEHGNILDLLAEFPTLEDGFDFDIVVFDDGRREWTPYYPRKGIARPNYVLEFGKNITRFSVNKDAVDLISQAYVTGGTSGEVKFEENYEDTAASAKYGVMTGIISEGSQNDVDWLLERAQREVNTRKTAKITPDVTVVNVPVVLLGVLNTGDSIPVWIHKGRTEIDSMFRIQAIDWAVQENTLKLEMIPA